MELFHTPSVIESPAHSIRELFIHGSAGDIRVFDENHRWNFNLSPEINR